VRIASHGLSRSGQKGTPCIAVVFEDEAGQRITYYGYLTDAALEYTVRALETMGWKPAEHDWRVDVLNDTDLLVGNLVEIVVEEEEYEGKVRSKVRFVNEIGGAMGERMPPDEAVVFATDLRARILTSKGPSPSKSPGAKPPPRRPAPPARQPVPADPGPVDDFNLDDVPF
jgi:hypothetical protein